MAINVDLSKGLFVPIGGASGTEPIPASAAPIIIAGNRYDASPYFAVQAAIGANLSAFTRNPYDPRPLVNLSTMAHQLQPHVAQIMHQPPAIRQAATPLLHGMTNYLAQTQNLVKMRLKSHLHIAKAPKILIPISLSIAAGATFTNVQVRNPYLGATGGSEGSYQYPWSITAFKTSNNENGQLQAIRITQFLLGGHDFVNAALGGLTYAGTAAPAVQGWPAAAFTETKRAHWTTVVQPWNVVAVQGPGVGWGSIMTETGFLQVSVFNGTAATYNDTYSVYANATLCGNPFSIGTAGVQNQLFRSSFVPLALQAPMALKIAQDAHAHIMGVVDQDNANYQGSPVANWYKNMERASRVLGGLLNETSDIAIGDPVDPSAIGIDPGASVYYG